ncbi:GntR family transcriptional regulator [Hoeflea sp. YIM 152468]|uniref:GntR family transcriptional regulator n=1 Tax=Hoeflea sp. YIM 152468 TaxID=3031759 RepID=UPI0023DB0F65|nr:GntR family transcriptional regulator [Hoeflea sp. YIM 152468]MDF1606689.1 GntR family transcriptional regulator [Hoeflea sp. YIM 152468]
MSTRIADSVRERIEQMIVTGDFADGERLDEVKLAEQFGVSRTPLREAFQSLAASGLLTLKAHRGAFIRHPDFVELVEMFEVMAEIEAMCGFRAARHVTESQMTAIGVTIEACEAAIAEGDFDEYYRENETFHHLLYEASGNRFLAREAARLHKRLKPYRRLQLRANGRMLQSMREHRAVFAALKRSDSKAAAATLRLHVAIQGERFNDLMASYRQLAALKTG